ncbi:LSU ribosomal protein L10P [Neorhodopirellula lusitana]|uniref:Large ribosomal subunit protein uL10 n=1 Tax=Neorhodopirellula lusitana TaxID=445327 RepID=A0ABY1Q295_9BACT|nr:50S ribosomal protein L10 [Neorhodopirellula lusitana]SMP55984.1 LSU ribosomal protein L10P [Neorhodopirellula lusitana]
MSKYVKELVTRDLQRRLEGVSDAVTVTCTGMDANTTNELRGELDSKNIQMMVVKNSLARRATEGSSLAPAFEGTAGQVAVIWGAEDFVSLVKEVVRLDKDSEKYENFVAVGGVMDGEVLDDAGVKAISKWPSREEQISMLVGQLLGPGSSLSAALLGPGRMLNSQIKQKGEGDDE